MKTRVSIIIMSQLSDVQELVYLDTIDDAEHQKQISIKLNFAKYLIQKHKDNTVEVDAEVEYEEFAKKHPNLV